MLVKNECKNSPLGLLRQVRRSLSWIHPADLHGIACIVLLDELEEPDLSSPEWHKRAKAEGVCVSGQYLSAVGKLPAQGNLYVRALYRGIPLVYRWTTAPSLSICYTLAHEVGHHLIAKRGYIFQDNELFSHPENKEEFCNRYAFGVTKSMMSRWHYRLGMWALKDLAGWYYAVGSTDWKRKNFKKAAENFYTSFHLDPNREDALNWYMRAKDEGHAQQALGAASPVSDLYSK
jgi:hypothetical protein